MEHKETKVAIIADYYSMHYEELKAFVASRLQFSDDTEDLVQNVFVRLLQMDKMITEITLPCLVYTVARNLITDYWRHKCFVDEYEHYIVRKSGKPVAEDPESVYSVKEMTEILERGIARLSDKQQKVYRMNVYDGVAVKDIASQLNVKYKNVEHRLGAARKNVREYFKKMLA